jgi:uncharacterized protein YxeA
MNKKTYIILLSIISMFIISTVNVSAYDGTLTIIDETGDVEKTDEEGTATSNNIYPDVDLKSVSFNQNGRQLDITMKLAEGGKFGDLTSVFMIDLFTTSNDGESPYGEYQIIYSSITELINQTGSPFIIAYGNYEEEISVKEYNDDNTDTLEFSFDLIDKNQRLLGAMIITNKYTTEEGNYYSDTYPQNIKGDEDIPSELYSIDIDAGGPYTAKTGQSLNLSGIVISGEITNDHEWFWIFDDSSITLDGQNPSYKFNTPETYTGTLYIYDGKNSWGLDTFEVNVTGTNINGDNNNNNEPGFEIILAIAAIAIALILFRKKKK